jgi:hypothetical protein
MNQVEARKLYKLLGKTRLSLRPELRELRDKVRGLLEGVPGVVDTGTWYGGNNAIIRG